jgi:hypothetical protein
MLQDVSTAILQHQQLHADGVDSPQQPGPPAAVLQPGLAALELLAAVCWAAAYPNLGDFMRLEERQQLCQRGSLDLPCMLPSMLAVGAAAVLGQEMQRRLCGTAATCAGSGAGSAAADAGGVCGADLAAPGATAPKDQSSNHSTAAAYTLGSGSGTGKASGSGSSKDYVEVGAGPSAIDAAWQLVCVTEQWAGGQLLPQPFTLLLEALGCHHKAFLLLACVWQQQQDSSGSQRQQPQAGGGSQQTQSTCSSQQADPQVLADLCQAHMNVFRSEVSHTSCAVRGPTALAQHRQRLSRCCTTGQHHPQHTQQHMLLALLLMREAIRRKTTGMFQAATLPDAAMRVPDRLGKCSFKAASAACGCVSTWLCWEQFERQPETVQEEPAAAGDPAAHSRHAAQRHRWPLGGESSTAVLLEVLQGHCLLLQEGARELQAVTSSWAATRSSTDSDDDNSSSNPNAEVMLTGEALEVDRIVANILGDVLGLLRALMATAAVDIGVLQQAAPHLFGLAGTLEQLVRLRCACHRERLALNIDCYMPQLLQMLLGSQDLLSYADFSRDLSTYAEPTQDATNAHLQQQQLSGAAAAARNSVCLCGLLPFLAAAAPLGGQQQRQLMGLLFSSLKLFSTYPAGLYAFSGSWAETIQDGWLEAACDTLWAACTAGRLLLVTGGPGAWDATKGTPGGSQAVADRASGSAEPESTAQGAAAGGQGSSCHSCGLGADGMGALLPWVVLQGRALQLWVALFRAHVQLTPAAEGSRGGAKSCKGQESRRCPYSLVGSVKALKLLARMFEHAVAPSTQLLAVVLQGAAFEGQQPVVEQAQRWKLQRMPEKVPLQTAMRQGTCFGHLVYGMPGFMWSGVNPAQDAWLRQQLEQRGQQLRVHCREQGLDLSRLEIASGSAAPAVQHALLTVMAVGDGLKQLGDSAQMRHRLRQSDVRRYLKCWEVGDAAVLKGVLAMLSGGEHSAAGVAVAAWLCSPSIAGDLLAQLQEFSSQLSTLPIHEACNNPSCRVTAGSKEQGLVSGKACVCAGCRVGHYCSRACQREHWPLHQLQCKPASGGRKH